MFQIREFLVHLDGMLVHRRSFPRNLLGFPQQFAGTYLYSWMEKGTVRVKYLARAPIARSVDERTNHEANPPPPKEDLNVEFHLAAQKIGRSLLC